jgi:hypothetical protein
MECDIATKALRSNLVGPSRQIPPHLETSDRQSRSTLPCVLPLATPAPARDPVVPEIGLL